MPFSLAISPLFIIFVIDKLGYYILFMYNIRMRIYLFFHETYPMRISPLA
nr:MAG TPA: hypothetical protein [Caudoviricetes sp.]